LKKKARQADGCNSGNIFKKNSKTQTPDTHCCILLNNYVTFLNKR